MLRFKTIALSIICFFTVNTLIAQKTATDSYNDGMKLIDDTKYKEAIDAFKDAIANKADYTDALYKAGWCYNEIEDYENAIIYLRKAVQLDDHTAKIFFELAYAYDNTDKADRAKMNYQKVLELDPEYYTADKNLGDIY